MLHSSCTVWTNPVSIYEFPSNKKCLEEGGSYCGSILRTDLPEQIDFNKAPRSKSRVKLALIRVRVTIYYYLSGYVLLLLCSKATLQQMMSTTMCIYSSLKHKHEVAWTAICYPAAINSLDASNSTSLCLILAYKKHFEEEGVNHPVTAYPASTILHLLLHVTSDTIKQAMQPRETVPAPGKHASEKGRDWHLRKKGVGMELKNNKP